MHKAEFPPLLKQGFHELTRSALRTMCVDAFPDSQVRRDIMAGLEVVLERVENVGINGIIWLDGSFTTEETDPGDVDFVLIADQKYRAEGSDEQQECVEWLIARENDPKASFRCDTDVILEFDSDSPFYELTETTKEHFQELYGFSVATKEPKGIMVLRVPEVDTGSGEGEQ